MSKFTFSTVVTDCDCDRNGKLKLSVMLEYFTNAAVKHYEELDLPRERLEKENFRFLLLQTAVKIYRLPEIGENLLVSTWEVGFDGMYFDRAYEICTQEGEKLVSSDGHWILTDLSHRILSPKKFPYPLGTGENSDIKCERMKKYFLSDFSSGIIHKVKSEDIDLNGHVHNTVYAAVACEYLPTDFWDKNWTEMRINWRNEAKLGDEWELFVSTEKILDGDEYKCVGFLGETQSFDFTLKTEN